MQRNKKGPHGEKKKSTETVPEKAPNMDILDKDFK